MKLIPASRPKNLDLDELTEFALEEQNQGLVDLVDQDSDQIKEKEEKEDGDLM